MKTAGLAVSGVEWERKVIKVLAGESSIGKWKAWNVQANQHLGPQCNAMILFIPDNKCNKDMLSKPRLD